MKNQDNIIPKFHCTKWINEQGYLKKYRSESCKDQCTLCMDIIIDHHFNKKIKEKP